MDTTQSGSIAEMQAVVAYMRDGWEVFLQSNGKAPFDLVVYRDKELRRVTVKATAQKSRNGVNSYITELRSIRPNRTGNKIKQLSEYDELYVYVHPWDEGFFFSPEEVNGRQAITLNRSKSYNTSPRRLTGMDEDTALKAAGG